MDLKQHSDETMSDVLSIINSKLYSLTEIEKEIIKKVWGNNEQFIMWPKKAILLWPNCVRVNYHKYPLDLKTRLKSSSIKIDTRSNGPAINAFLFAGGRRPKRNSISNREWSIHHIYDGKFPWLEQKSSLHSVKDGKHFTQSAGLVAIHPIADALADEYSYFAWMLRREAFIKFGYDPDNVFSGRTDELGFVTKNDPQLKKGVCGNILVG